MAVKRAAPAEVAGSLAELDKLRRRYLALRGKPTNAHNLRSLRRVVRELEARVAQGEDVRARPTGHAKPRPLSMSDRQWQAVQRLTVALGEKNSSSTVRRALRLLAADSDPDLARDLEET